MDLPGEAVASLISMVPSTPMATGDIDGDNDIDLIADPCEDGDKQSPSEW